jgi:hypothetical protein
LRIALAVGRGLLRDLLALRLGFIALGALGLAAGIIVDAGNLDGATIGIDADGAPAILERVLGLRRSCGREQNRGDRQELLHLDLQCRESVPNYPRAASHSVTRVTFKT